MGSFLQGGDIHEFLARLGKSTLEGVSHGLSGTSDPKRRPKTVFVEDVEPSLVAPARNNSGGYKKFHNRNNNGSLQNNWDGGKADNHTSNDGWNSGNDGWEPEPNKNNDERFAGNGWGLESEKNEDGSSAKDGWGASSRRNKDEILVANEYGAKSSINTSDGWGAKSSINTSDGWGAKSSINTSDGWGAKSSIDTSDGWGADVNSNKDEGLAKDGWGANVNSNKDEGLAKDGWGAEPSTNKDENIAKDGWGAEPSTNKDEIFAKNGWTAEMSENKDEKFAKDGWGLDTSISGAPAETGWGTPVTGNIPQSDSGWNTSQKPPKMCTFSDNGGASQRRSGRFGPSGSNTVALGKRRVFESVAKDAWGAAAIKNKDESSPANEWGAKSTIKTDGSNSKIGWDASTCTNKDDDGWGAETSDDKDESFAKDGWGLDTSINRAPAESGWGNEVTENNPQSDSTWNMAQKSVEMCNAGDDDDGGVNERRKGRFGPSGSNTVALGNRRVFGTVAKDGWGVPSSKNKDEDGWGIETGNEKEEDRWGAQPSMNKNASFARNGWGPDTSINGTPSESGWGPDTSIKGTPAESGWGPDTSINGIPSESGWSTQVTENSDQSDSGWGGTQKPPSMCSIDDNGGVNGRRSGRFGPSGSNTIALGKRRVFKKEGNNEFGNDDPCRGMKENVSGNEWGKKQDTASTDDGWGDVGAVENPMDGWDNMDQEHDANQRRRGAFGPSRTNKMPLGKRARIWGREENENTSDNIEGSKSVGDVGWGDECENKNGNSWASGVSNDRATRMPFRDNMYRQKSRDWQGDSRDSRQGQNRRHPIKGLLGASVSPELDELQHLCKKILHYSEYQIGEKLKLEDQEFLLEKLVVHHPAKDEKLGCGIDYVMIDAHPDHEAVCFFLVRKDGSRTDFSYWKCLQGMMETKYPELLKDQATQDENETIGTVTSEEQWGEEVPGKKVGEELTTGAVEDQVEVEEVTLEDQAEVEEATLGEQPMDDRVGEDPVEDRMGEDTVEDRVGQDTVENRVGEDTVEDRVGEDTIEDRTGEDSLGALVRDGSLGALVGEETLGALVGEEALEALLGEAASLEQGGGDIFHDKLGDGWIL